MGAHVFITDTKTFPTVRDYGFWGVGAPKIPDNYHSLVQQNLANGKLPYFAMVADLLATRIGDLVFLYERGRGFHGVYRIASEPFFDATPVGSVSSQWPLRVLIECVHYFPDPVPEAYLFSTPEYETRCWSWFYRKIQGPRGSSPLNPEAAQTLCELLVKVNGNAINLRVQRSIYQPKQSTPIKLPLPIDGKVALEDILRGWFVQNIDDPHNKDMRDLFGPSGDIEWFANNVPHHVSGRHIDLLCYHANQTYTRYPLRYRFTVVELKRDEASPDDIGQIIEYSKWVAGRLACGEVDMVVPVIVAHSFQKDAIVKAKHAEFNSRGIKLIKYDVRNQSVLLKEVQK
ncbi:MAG: hypothetical protein NZ959_03180 [Armatimonadetes bacterium]|nr:hypothetical protein [Armatimonadota bacterium]MDW8121546.1 hypothetical protein [Armatimonadota bacterium]